MSPLSGCNTTGSEFGHVGPVRPEHGELIYSVLREYLIRVLNAVELERDKDFDAEAAA